MEFVIDLVLHKPEIWVITIIPPIVLITFQDFEFFAKLKFVGVSVLWVREEVRVI